MADKELWEDYWDRLTDSDVIREAERERKSSRFRLIRSVLERELGHINGLEVIEIGSGLGRHSLALALLGAKVTLVDYTEVALDKAARLFRHYGQDPTLINSDVFMLDESLRGRFDACMSSGLAEHFSGEQRQNVFKAHLDLLKDGGVAIVSVPYRFCPTYRLWLSAARITGRFKLPETGFSRSELRRIATRLGVDDYHIYGMNFCLSIDSHLLAFPKYVLRHLRLTAECMRLPDVRLPLIDNLFGSRLLFVARNHSRSTSEESSRSRSSAEG